MNTDRLRLDPFALALGALALLTLAFVSARNGAALVMCVLCFAGLLSARLIGFSNRALVPLALGLIALLWIVWSNRLRARTRPALSPTAPAACSPAGRWPSSCAPACPPCSG